MFILKLLTILVGKCYPNLLKCYKEIKSATLSKIKKKRWLIFQCLHAGHTQLFVLAERMQFFFTKSQHSKGYRYTKFGYFECI